MLSPKKVLQARSGSITRGFGGAGDSGFGVLPPVAGVRNLRRVLDTDPLTWMQRWTVANYAENRPEGEDVEVLFTQPSWDFPSIFEEEMGYLPLAPRILEPNDAMNVTLRGGGSSYVVLRALPGRHARLNSVRSGVPVVGEFRASVMRIE